MPKHMKENKRGNKKKNKYGEDCACKRDKLNGIQVPEDPDVTSCVAVGIIPDL